MWPLIRICTVGDSAGHEAQSTNTSTKAFSPMLQGWWSDVQSKSEKSWFFYNQIPCWTWKRAPAQQGVYNLGLKTQVNLSKTANLHLFHAQISIQKKWSLGDKCSFFISGSLDQILYSTYCVNSKCAQPCTNDFAHGFGIFYCAKFKESEQKLKWLTIRNFMRPKLCKKVISKIFLEIIMDKGQLHFTFCFC